MPAEIALLLGLALMDINLGQRGDEDALMLLFDLVGFSKS